MASKGQSRSSDLNPDVIRELEAELSREVKGRIFQFRADDELGAAIDAYVSAVPGMDYSKFWRIAARKLLRSATPKALAVPKRAIRPTTEYVAIEDMVTA